MNILALESAAEPSSVALLINDEIVSAFCAEGFTNSETLLPLAEELLRAKNLTFADIHAVAFGLGPGSFTGLRVSCGIAQGFAIARNLPLLGIHTLAAMAFLSGKKKVMVTLDARMNEVYFAAFINGKIQGKTAVLPSLEIPLPEIENDEKWTIIGNGLIAYPELYQHFASISEAFMPEIMPDAAAILALAMPRLLAGETILPENAKPLYVRDKVAKTTAERQLEQAGKSAS